MPTSRDTTGSPASPVQATVQGAVAGGVPGALAGAGTTMLTTPTGRRTLIGVLVVVVSVAVMFTGFIVSVAIVIVQLPHIILSEATHQLEEFLDEGWSAITGAYGRYLDVYLDDIGDAPWSALYAVEEDTAARGGLGEGPYGFDTQTDWTIFEYVDIFPWLNTGLLWDEWTTGCKGAAFADLEDRSIAGQYMNCLMADAVHHLDPDFTDMSVYDGVEEYTTVAGRTAYRIDPDDPAGRHAKTVYTTMFESLPIENAKSRAPGLYDLMMRAALGILDSCATGTTATLTPGVGMWANPMAGVITDTYGWRTHPVYHYPDFHNAVDLAAPCGTELHAVANGTVTFAGWSGGYGGLTIIDHGDGVDTRYAHQEVSQMTVAPGDTVSVGQVIGREATTGTSTGCHLHFEVHVADARDGEGGTTTDPMVFLSERGITVGTDGVTNQGAPVPLNTDEFSAADEEGHLYTFDARQIANARIIVTAGHNLNAPDVVVVAAVAAGIVESGLLNLANASDGVSATYPNEGVAPGDEDSIGVFQQRPSQGWGSIAQIMGSVDYQAEQFYTRAIPVVDMDATLTAGQIAYRVQRCSSEYAHRYTTVTPVAQALVSAVRGTFTPAPVCSTGTGNYSGSGQGIADAARDMAGWGGAYLWGGGHGTVEDLQARIAARFRGTRVVPLDETPPGDDNPGSTVNDQGVDCSGFVRAVLYQVLGVDTGSWATSPGHAPADVQAMFTKVSEDQAQPGDIVHTASHTAIVLSVDVSTSTYVTADFSAPDLGSGIDTRVFGYATQGVYRWVGAP